MKTSERLQCNSYWEGKPSSATSSLTSLGLLTRYSIEKHPDHLLSTLLLGAIGTLEKDEAVMGSVVEDLEATLGDSSKSQEDILKANRLLLAIRKSLVGS